jgi:uncharacterized membrane protein YgcG
VRLSDGALVPIEDLRPGDRVASLHVPGLDPDAPDRAQYLWRTDAGDAKLDRCDAAVASVTRGEHEGFYLVNGRIKATFEHPLLVRRGHELGFCSVEMLRLGDVLLRHDLTEEAIATIDRFDGIVATVAIHVPGTNTYVADGIWAHNDLAQFAGSASSSSSESGSSSASDSGKSSGSSFSSSSASSSSSGSSSAITVPFGGVTVPF